MTTPLTTEMPQRLEPVVHDTFIDDLTGPVAAVWLLDAGRPAHQVQAKAGSHAA